MTSSYYANMTSKELVQHTEYAGSETVQLLTRHLIDALDHKEEIDVLVRHFGVDDLHDLKKWVTDLEDWQRDMINIMDEFGIDNDAALKERLSSVKTTNSVLWEYGIEDPEELRMVLEENSKYEAENISG